MQKRNISHGLIALALCVLFSIFYFLDDAALNAAAPPTPTPAFIPRIPGMPLSGVNLLPPPSPPSQLRRAAPEAPRGAFGSAFGVNTDSAWLHHDSAIAIDPSDPQRILVASNNYASYPTNNPYYYLSTNGGATWVEGMLVGASSGGDPWVAFDKLGQGYLVAHLGCCGTVNRQTYIGRLLANNTWEAYVRLSPDTNNQATDKPFVAVDQSNGAYANRIYAAWMTYINDANSNVNWIVLRYADANTFPTFSPVIPVSPSFATVNSWVWVAVGADSAVYVAYVTYYPPNKVNQFILVSKSLNGGVSFTQTYTISASSPANWNSFYARSQLAGALSGGVPQHFIVNNGPQLVAHPADPNKLAVVWMEGYACPTPATCTNTHIVSSFSTNGGATWSTPLVVNDDNDAGARDHFLPALAVGRDGVLHASWYDRRVTLNCANPFLYNEFYSDSPDWGQTWSRNARVSTASSDPANPLYNPGLPDPLTMYVGDYSGIAVAADNSGVMPAWTDTRTGKQNIYAARAAPPVSAPVMTNRCNYFPALFR